MAEKEQGLPDTLKDALGYISKALLSSLFPPASENTSTLIHNVRRMMIRMERRIVRKMCTLLIMGFGLIFLSFALLFFLIEYMGWSKTLAFFCIGAVALLIGLLLKALEFDR